MTAGKPDYAVPGVSALRLPWPMLSAPPNLTKNNICVALVDFRQLLARHDLRDLTPVEHRRGQRYLAEDKRQLYLAGRLALRMQLCQFTGLPNEDLLFSYGDRGKPYLKNSANEAAIQFNYTVSRQYGLYAFSQSRELGVDLEIFPRTVNANAMARTRLHITERHAWDALPVEQQSDAMLACWTRKEAYGKLIGVGIRFHLKRVPVFADLSVPDWHLPVTGLFTGEDHHLRQVHGMQLELPTAGAASIMYGGEALTQPPSQIQSYLYTP